MSGGISLVIQQLLPPNTSVSTLFKGNENTFSPYRWNQLSFSPNKGSRLKRARFEICLNKGKIYEIFGELINYL
jgi:hypothetical protein